MSAYSGSPSRVFKGERNIAEAATLETPNSCGAATLDVAVVGPTYRRPALLERCLNGLLVQAYDSARFEIIVCDDGSDESTRSCLTRLARDRGWCGPAIRYLAVTGTQGLRVLGMRAGVIRAPTTSHLPTMIHCPIAIGSPRACGNCAKAPTPCRDVSSCR
jgi:hypothetical protein